jgi:ElaB/YqjD/DUF883 family membrane-anchored ribosome-binding protein
LSFSTDKSTSPQTLVITKICKVLLEEQSVAEFQGLIADLETLLAPNSGDEDEEELAAKRQKIDRFN